MLVVGGGPAGSATAHHLATAGASVLLADKATFPRDKPCGGGLTTRAFLRCPVDPTPVVEEKVDVVELRFRYGDSSCGTLARPVIWMTQRRRLDAFLLDAAREQGVEVREGATRRDRRRDQDRRPARRGRCGRRRGRGKRNDCARARSRRRHRSRCRARGQRRLRARLPRPLPGPRGRRARRDIPGGYGWVFPKGDHVNVGVGAWEAEGPRLREYLGQTCAAHGLEPDDLESSARSSPSAPAAGHAHRRRARAPRRRRRRADRSGLGRRDVRVLRLGVARGRGDRATCSPAAPRRSPATRAPWMPRSARFTALRGSSRGRSTGGRPRAGGSRGRSSSGARSSGCCSASSRPLASSTAWRGCRCGGWSY